MSEKFGDKLRQMRTGKGVTLEVLAAAVGSSKAYMWQLENKPNAKPSAEMLLKLAGYFSQSPEFFIDDGQIEPSENQMEDSFFRKFKKLSDSDKRTIERMISGLEEKEPE
ncbi:helix-turn-helix domain-containing protein [Parasphingopyxis lamellibrachiae]|uniref:Xre family transcriptional regulator n=1 Tax=Parasphingopyxis lamellibrachiae TaxID=680125 RepID=A0A3D9FG09_9SPHN|nr:helix-turn-helix transcriptional regulator [Parasphingopyxis lamellibrachiae]RED16719.1 Xre family transcriptional regulator [Parasphingopyxis lamellibrachiae]